MRNALVWLCIGLSLGFGVNGFAMGALGLYHAAVWLLIASAVMIIVTICVDAWASQ